MSYQPISDDDLNRIEIELVNLHPDSKTRYTDQMGRLVARLREAELRTNAIGAVIGQNDFLEKILKSVVKASGDSVREGWAQASVEHGPVIAASTAAEAAAGMGFAVALETLKTIAHTVEAERIAKLMLKKQP